MIFKKHLKSFEASWYTCGTILELPVLMIAIINFFETLCIIAAPGDNRDMMTLYKIYTKSTLIISQKITPK